MKDIDFHFHQQYILSKQVDKSIGDIRQDVRNLKTLHFTTFLYIITIYMVNRTI